MENRRLLPSQCSVISTQSCIHILTIFNRPAVASQGFISKGRGGGGENKVGYMWEGEEELQNQPGFRARKNKMKPCQLATFL